MKTEELKALGLNETQVQEVFKLNSLAIENVKGQYSNLETSKAELEAKLLEMQESNKDVITQEAHQLILSEKETLANELLSIKEAHAKEIENIQFNNILDMTLKEAGAKSLKATKAVLNADTIKLNEGKLEGLEEELSRLKGEYEYLFINGESSKSNEPKITSPSKGRRNTDNDPFARKKAKYR